MKITHLFVDNSGVSHFKDIEIETNLIDFAPPAPKVGVSRPIEAKRQLFLVLPKDWFGDMHPAPNRQLMTIVTGALEVTASDGVKHTFKPGDTALVEDTVGEGHATKNAGSSETMLTVVQY